MARLFRVNVRAVDGVRIDFEIMSLIVEAGRPPESQTFALGLIVELWWRITELGAGAVEPSGVDLESAKRLALVPETKRFATLHALTQAGTPSAADWAAFAGAAESLVRSVQGRGYENQAAYESWPDVGIDDAEWTAIHADPVKLAAYRATLPRMQLQVELVEPAVAPFVMVGMRWESVVYR